MQLEQAFGALQISASQPLLNPAEQARPPPKPPCAVHTCGSFVLLKEPGVGGGVGPGVGVARTQLTVKGTSFENTSAWPPETLCTHIWSKVSPLVDDEIGMESFTATGPLGSVSVAPLTTCCALLT